MLIFVGPWPLVTIRAAWTATRPVDEEVSCELLVVGGGLAGVATAYEALKAGHTVCVTEITDWLGGQISSSNSATGDDSTNLEALQRRLNTRLLAMSNKFASICLSTTQR